jgi:CheY-like chemotaxis protein
MHGGRISASSGGPGQGSEFVIHLAADPAEPTPEPAPPESGNRPIPAIARRILVVDDNHDAAESLAHLLRTLGHDVRSAYDATTALEAAHSFGPEVVVSDIGLPRMDGYELARRLREVSPLEELLLVAMSGYGQEEDLRRSREAGFDLHLVKPVDLERLQEFLARPRALTSKAVHTS